MNSYGRSWFAKLRLGLGPWVLFSLVVTLPVWAGSISTDIAANVRPIALDHPAADESGGWIGGLDADGRLTLDVNRSRVLTLANRLRSADREGAALTEGSADIASINIVSPTSIIVTGRKPGSTNLIIEDELGRRQVIDVLVEGDLGTLREQLKSLDSAAAIDVSCDNVTLVLRGQAPNLNIADEAAQIATAYVPSGGRLVNLIEVGGGQQVMLEVKFAEVSKTVETELGVNFGYTDGTTFVGSNIGAAAFGLNSADLLAADPLTAAIPAANTILGNIRFNTSAFDYFVNCLRQDNLVRTLAEPTLIALSGETASFQAGGEIPIPVPQSGSGSSASPVITIQYQPYGVLLHFTPVVLGDGRIRLKIDPEVSALDKTNSVESSGFNIPALTTRSVDTTVELSDGQTFTIAGLLDDQVSGTNSEIPGLGDLPILGALFRSESYQRNQTELVVMVTPRLVEGVNPDKVGLAPGEHWRYPTEADLFFFRDLGGELPGKVETTATAPAPQFRGQYGFVPTDDTEVLEH